MGKAVDYDSFGVDDRPDRLSNVPDEALEALLEEEREKPAENVGRGMEAQYRLGNRARRQERQWLGTTTALSSAAYSQNDDMLNQLKRN